MQMVDNCKLVVRDAVNASATGFTTATNSVNMKNYNRCRITLVLTQSGAGTATVTLKQGTTTTASTALAFAEYWKNELGTDVLTKTTATTLTTAGAFTGDNIYIFEVKAEDLDKTSANTFIRMNVASISNNTAAALFYDLYEPRYATAGDQMISAES